MAVKPIKFDVPNCKENVASNVKETEAKKPGSEIPQWWATYFRQVVLIGLTPFWFRRTPAGSFEVGSNRFSIVIFLTHFQVREIQ